MTMRIDTKPRRMLAWALLAVAALGTAAAAVKIHLDRPREILIGVGQPLSGPLAPMGKDMLQGAQIAADELNAKGGVLVDGRRLRVEIVAADDRADVEAGRQAAKQLVDARVLAAIAHLNSGVSIAAAPVYAAAGIPQLAISTKPQYTQLGLPTTLRLVANDDLQAGAIGSFAVDLPGAKRFAVVDDGSPYGTSLANGADAAIRQRSGQVVLKKSLDNQTTDFRETVAALAETRADVLVTTLSDFQVEALMPQMAAAGLQHVRILGSDNMKTERMTKLQPTIREVYATTPIAAAHEFPNGKTFLAEYKRRHGADPYYAGHYAYDAVILVTDALARNESLDKVELLARLKRFDGRAPVTGSLRMREDGELRYGAIGVYRLEARRWDLLLRSDRW
jgi:branched-chain amino acid transport system substrate-binding protein